MKKQYGSALTNTIMLYILTIAKTIFPLIILPFLTRVLSVECYGVVSYVKSLYGYEQIIIDFGFMLSAVKDIVKADGNKQSISNIIGDTIVSKLLIATVSFVLFCIVGVNIELLQGQMLFVLLSLCVPVISCFLMDFLFRGIEKMHYITIVYVFMKAISTALTVIMVRSDADVLMIPIFDIISSLLAVGLSWYFVKKMGYAVKFTSFIQCLNKIRDSFQYFANSMASTAFGSLNTLVIGAYMSDAQQIAYWSVCMQIIGAVQNLYTPISNGIYPYMIKTRDLKFIKKVMLIFMPLIIIGTFVCFKISPFILTIVAGGEYSAAAGIFKYLLPILIISFPVAILGWPALGAINRVKETTLGTVYGAVFQILGLVILILTNNFTLIYIAIIRNLSEFIMFFSRLLYLRKYKSEFN